MPFNEGVQDQPSAVPSEFYRMGGVFDSRPRKSVEDGDDVIWLFDNHGRPYVRAEISEPLTSFGEVSTAEFTPLLEIDFPYNNNPRIMQTLLDGSGSVSVANMLATLSTGTDTGSDVLFDSVEHAKYHMGQGMQGRFACAFASAGTAGTEALIGFGNEEDLLGFGWNGTVFSLLHRFGGAVEYRTLTFTTGAVTQGGTVTVTLDGTATETEVTNGGSVQNVAREVGATSYAGWETQVIGADVIFISHFAEAKAGAFSFGDTDGTGVVATAGVVQSVAGVAPTDTWIPQTEWNADQMNGTNDAGTNPSQMTLVPGNGNTYEVEYQDGFGDMLYFIENQNTGKFHLVHRISYTNQNTTVNIQNPTLPAHAAVKNKLTTTDITLMVSSMSIFTEGEVVEEGLANSTSSTITGSTTELAIFSIKNKPIYQSVENRVEFISKRFSVGGNGTGGAKFTTIRIRLNTTLGGDPVFTDISTSTSIIAVDTAGTTVSGGAIISTFGFRSVFNEIIDLVGFAQNLPPGSLLTITGQVDQGGSELDAGLNWRELF